ncbi:MAG: class E sortase [Clostridiales bacterium]
MKKRLLLLLTGFLLIIFIIVLIMFLGIEKEPPETNIPPSIPQKETVKSEELPYDKLFISPQRQKYKDKSLILKIPKLNIDSPIVNGTTLDDLKRGPGLYEYAQLPTEKIANTSIAGHRDIHGSIFYHLNELKDGDFCYLIYQDQVYRYQYQDTNIVEQDDWSPIYNQGFSCLTLTTCEPIGVSDHRLIVICSLSEQKPLTNDYQFTSAAPK